eukprot:4423055-Prymnesium_polylepis.1
MPARAALETTRTPLALGVLDGMSNQAVPELNQQRSVSKPAARAVGPAPAAGSALAQTLAPLAPSQRRSHVESAVLDVVRELTGTPAAELTSETPLMEAGVDSLAATELSSRLRALTGVALSPTIVFEQPSPRAVASHLLEQVEGEE